MASESCVVARIKNYTLVGSEVINGKVNDVVRRVAAELLREWDPERGDFMVLRDDRVIQVKLPLPSPELYDRLKNYNIRRSGDSAEATIPVYEIIYSGNWVSGGFRAEDAVLVFPFISSELNNQIISDVINALKAEEAGFEEE
ncbi:MAG: DUF2286 domain-containing protein [Caldivirga sp.]|jgi:hypothetical protein